MVKMVLQKLVPHMELVQHKQILDEIIAIAHMEQDHLAKALTHPT